MKAKALTREQRDNYIESGAQNCPHCGSEILFNGSFNCDIDYASRTVTCEECDNEWVEIFTLTNIEPLEE
jgi:transcription elongation factor Elf1